MAIPIGSIMRLFIAFIGPLYFRHREIKSTRAIMRIKMNPKLCYSSPFNVRGIIDAVASNRP
jgi:hypothetical protein